ncbi:MAG: ATP-binding protein [Candidatus Phocaeicola faecigallinarum]|uniref:ATP-binding protein n=1 Tax=Candidatus Phocaeicola faecigallinarum TaxID=2838732 RepID=A0A948TE99_9BACT|nr:ATP-binding protein [Candidatus Phocaeicola faecigallinarum]
MKYPIGIQSFDRIIEDDYVYVDKTDMVYSLVKEGSIYFLSRPRRFGKSLLVSTLKNYFLGRKELFKGLKIDALEKDWKVYPVFHIDFNGSNFMKRGILENRINSYISDWEKEYSLDSSDIEADLGNRFLKVLKTAYERSGLRAVVLIDEYDKPILDVLDYDKNLEEEHRNILKGFYSTFKGADEYLQFVFLTGVTKFSQVSVFSGFNQPKDISMHAKYETLCGISQYELESYFREPIEEMTETYRCSYDEMMNMLKSQYDGYHFSDRMTDVYNPFSLLNAFDSGRVYDFWFKSGTPTYLVRLLSHSNENLNEITGKYYSPEEFIDYKANVEQPLPMIYQSGYLTIKKFNLEEMTFLLDFPNNEVKRGFLTMVASSYFGDKMETAPWIRKAVSQLKKGEIDDFRTGMTAFLASIPYTMRRKENEREKERYFHYTFYLIMRLMSVYTVYTEKVQSHGRVDCIVETQDYVYIFEFKLDGTADEAMRQIEDKGYAREYESGSRRVYKIAAVFSSETGNIEEWMVG